MCFRAIAIPGRSTPSRFAVRWHYLEHDWIATEGSYAFEPPGETHTLVIPEDVPEMITLFHVTGGYVYVDPQGVALGYEDVFTKLEKQESIMKLSARVPIFCRVTFAEIQEVPAEDYSSPTVAPGIRRRFFEARVPAEKNEIQRARWTVALLGDNQFGFGTVLFGKIASCKNSVD